MDYDLGDGAERLRGELRRLIAEHVPSDFLGAFSDDPGDIEIAQRFCKVLAAEGLLAQSWPVESGGGGGTVWEQTVVREEMWAHHEPRGAQYMGLNWVGPAIMRHGTPEQQALHLPRIAGGDVIWCQGFSEPEAGSDLASLRTRAEPDGDGWRITGQKIWTSYAQIADWCVLAARTSTEERKQGGITMFLVPMDRDGVEVRPIASVLGPHHLNEVFLDGVWAGPLDVLGPVGDGWRVIKDALSYERVGIARYARGDRLLQRVRERLGPSFAELPPGLRARWTRALVHNRVARLLCYAVIDAQGRGDLDDGAAAAARIFTTLCDQEVAEVLMEALGPHALDDRATPGVPLDGAVEDHWRYSQAATVAAGTIEVQRSIVARSVLT